MKKIFFLFFILFSLFTANAKSDFSEKTFNIGISFPYITNDYKTDEFDMLKINAVGINLNARKMTSDINIGIFLDTDIFFPYSKVIIWDDNYQTTTNSSDYEYFFGMDFLAGIYGILYQNNTINIPLGLGFHADGFISKEKFNNSFAKESTYSIGIGAWINFEVSMTKHLGIYAGSKFSYDFHYNNSYKYNGNERTSGKCKCISFIPALGLTWYF